MGSRRSASVNPRGLLGHEDRPLEVQRPCLTLRDHQEKIQRLEREIFNLKLERYHHEEWRKKVYSMSPSIDKQIALEEKLREANMALKLSLRRLEEANMALEDKVEENLKLKLSLRRLEKANMALEDKAEENVKLKLSLRRLEEANSKKEQSLKDAAVMISTMQEESMKKNRFIEGVEKLRREYKVWFQNRRAKWRKQARLQLLQDAWRMRCLSLGTPPVMGGGAGAGSTPGAGNRPGSQAPENLSAGKDADMTEVNNGHSPGSFTMMHPAFQQQQQQQQQQQGQGQGQEQEKLSKTYTELKLYKAPGHGMELGGMTALSGHSDEGSDGSDSEEIDLTSGACIDFSQSSKLQQQQQQQQQQQGAAGATAANGVL